MSRRTETEQYLATLADIDAEVALLLEHRDQICRHIIANPASFNLMPFREVPQCPPKVLH